MRTSGALFYALALACSTLQAADKPSLKQVVKEAVEQINNAIIKEDFAKVVELTHPKIVEGMGGSKKMISVMESGAKEMKAAGVRFLAFKVGDPSDPIAGGTDLYVVVPFVLEMKVSDGKLVQKSFVIGVSSDEGKKWVFVTGDIDLKEVKKVLPNLPEKLKLPDPEKPVLFKDGKEK